MKNLLTKIFARIKRMIGTGAEAGDNIAFWLVYGIPGIIIIIGTAIYTIAYFIRWLRGLF